MANVQENVKSFPIGIGPIAASAKNAQKAEVWAEGTDEQVSELGGTHSAKGWATSAAGYASDPNIVACGTNISSINTVASNISDVSSVAGINGSVSAVAGISDDITTVAGKKDDISTCANNIADISAAPTSASDAAASAASASNSATNAQKWAEGADSAVTPMGGTHSAKGWAEQAQSIVSSLGTVLHYKGSVANYAALQAVTGQIVGDVYNVTDTGDNYAWDGSTWDKLSGTVDLSAYRTAAAQDVIDAGKQPLLPAGTTGNYLQKTADGVQWNSVDALPSQTGHSGEFLTTDGTSASWATVSVPQNVWTSDNLKAGKNIELVQKTYPYVIDEHTLACFHCDNSKHSSGGTLGTSLYMESVAFSSSISYVKFGTYAASITEGVSNFGDGPYFQPSFISLPASYQFTIDFWAAMDSTTVNNQPYWGPKFYLLISGTSTLCSFALCADKARIMKYNGDVIAEFSGNGYPIDTNKHHYALSMDTNRVAFWFCDGVYMGSCDCSSFWNPYQPALRGFGARRKTTQAAINNLWIDELRISDVVRWTQNDSPFQVPTEAYAEASTEPWYVIDNKLKAGSNIAIASDGTISATFTGVSGYDATKTQVLKNVNGTLTWVDEA